MGVSQRTKILAIVVLIVTGIATISLVYLQAPPDSEYVPGYGFCYISDTQGANSNSSYSVGFHGVNFTFLYWYWPMYGVMNNVTVFVAEQRVQVYVLIEFSDDYSETVQFEVDSPSSCLIGPDPALQVYSASHASLFAAVATANTEELQSNWVYLVGV